MAVIKSSALYGTGVFGGSVLGTRNVSFALTGVSGTGAIEPVSAGGFEIDISERLGNVSATGSVNTVTVNIQEDIVGVSATGTVNGALEFSNTHSLASVSATGSIGTLAISNTVGLTGVAGTTAVESVSAGGFEIDITEKVTGVSATGAVTAVQPVFNFTEILPSFGLTGSIGTISLNVKEELGANAVTSVSGTASVNSVTVHTSAGVTTPAITASLGTISKTAVQFDFEAVKNLYSRRRTVTLSRAA
jgi:hypothetical protein